jgi:hypothetical protein
LYTVFNIQERNEGWRRGMMKEQPNKRDGKGAWEEGDKCSKGRKRNEESR